jgi:hypothetical protein
MRIVLEIAIDASAALFAWYGLSCFTSRTMIAEFDRYGLPRLRILTGVLQLAGTTGLILGHRSRAILLISAGGLALMMFFALMTRIKIRDPLYAALPSLSLCLLNCYIFASSL